MSVMHTDGDPVPAPAPLIHRVRDWLRSDMRVLRWVFAALYLCIILGLLGWDVLGGANGLLAGVAATLVVSQALFILGAGTINLCRPIRKRRLWMPVLVASIMFGLLVAGLAIALMELTYFDKRLDKNDTLAVAFWCFVFGNWLLWAPLIWVYARNRPRITVLRRLTAALFAGSLAELLAAVPSHVIVSKRPGCLVGLGTLLGIVAGIHVMLFSFGPAVVLLFLRPRYRRERMEVGTTCWRCGYDLRGTLAAGRWSCPECGAPARPADAAP